MNANELADKFWQNYLDNNECEHGFALSSGCHNDECKEQALYDAATMLRQQQALVNQRDDEIKALYNLVTEQDKKIIDLAFKLAYAERSNEVVKEAKYGITTKWDGITTYHETTEPIGKAQEK